MATPLLTTKFHIPQPRSELILRPRLIEKINAGLGTKLTLISAPAGFGKTTLVSAWLVESNEEDCVWLSLDQYDDDPNRFWQYVLAALQTVVPNIGKGIQQVVSSNPLPPPPILLTGLLNELDNLPHQLVLVLDDCHHIANRSIHEGLDYLIEHAPPQLNFVLISRADPPLSLARLRARGQLQELRLTDLRFDVDESAAFLNETMRLDLDDRVIEMLEQRTEGWITGLQLTALSLRGQKDAGDFVERFTGSHQYILDYLTEEVLQQQPESVQTFLLQTSILERLSVSLCDAVTGRDNSHTILDQLYRQNLFIAALDDDLQWFRYHRLMADLLGNRLRQTMTVIEIQELHKRASKWCEKHGSWETAIAHAIAAGEWKRTAHLVARAYHPLLSQGRIATWQGWLEQIPETFVQADLSLQIRRGWTAFLNGQVKQAENMLTSARQTLLSLPPTPEHQALRGELATYLANIAFFHEESETIIKMAEEALAYLPPEQVIARARATGALGLGVSLAGDTHRAMDLFYETVEMSRTAGNKFFLAHALEVVADGQYHSGQLCAAAETCREIIDLGSSGFSSPLPFVGPGLVKLAGIYVEWQELERAKDHLEKGLALSRQGGLGYNSLTDLCIQVRLLQAMGEGVEALTTLRRAESIFKATQSRIMSVQLAACEVQFWLNAGDVARAAAWAEGHPPISKPIPAHELPLIGREVQMVSLARVRLAQGRPQEVLAIYDQVSGQAQMAGRTARVIEISLLQALALQALDRSTAALGPLQQCLALATPEGYVRLFLDAGESVVPLLRLAQAQGNAIDYMGRLLGECRASGLFPTSNFQPLPEALSPREIQVLQLIGEGYSNQQIAETLIITLNTVKKHSSHIYEKLGVQGRTQAVARAHELGLLEPQYHMPV